MLKKLQATLKNQKAKLKNQKGFTLIELIVVIAILGVLAMLIMPSVMSFQSNADEAVAKQQFKILNQSYLAKKALGAFDSNKASHDGIKNIDTAKAVTYPANATAEQKLEADKAHTAKLTVVFGDSVSSVKVKDIKAPDLDAANRNNGLENATIMIKSVLYKCTLNPDGTVDSVKVDK